MPARAELGAGSPKVGGRSAYANERIPFAEAIQHHKLLKAAWDTLSKAQQVVVLVFYGQPLRDKEDHRLWSAFQAAGIYDDLGYLQQVTLDVPYVPREYTVLTALLGRRSGKSDMIAGFIAAYEILLGGHGRFAKPEQDIYWLYVAQDLQTAQANLKFILGHVLSSPWLAKLLVKPGVEENVFATGVVLRAEPPVIKVARGAAVCGVTMDEMAFWYKDAKSANPDFEVVRSISYAMQQFQGLAKQLRTTTPWTKEGLAYAASLAGTEGRFLSCGICTGRDLYTCPHTVPLREKHRGILVVQAPTAMMGNPLISRQVLADLRNADEEAFRRESLAQFIGTRDGFLEEAPLLASVSGKVYERAPERDVQYVGAMDPAFRHDSFAFTIGHMDAQGKVVQDVAKAWEPIRGEPLEPNTILAEIGAICKEYDLSLVYSDQHHLESLQQLADLHGFSVIGFDLTAQSKSKIMLDLKQMVRRGKLDLLDDAQQTDELLTLQQTRGRDSNRVHVEAAPGKKDDRAVVVALMVHQALFTRNDLAAAPPTSSTGSERLMLLRYLQAKRGVGEDPLIEEGLRQAMVASLLVLNNDDDAGEGVAA